MKLIDKSMLIKTFLTSFMLATIFNVPKVSVFPLILFAFTYCFFWQIKDVEVEKSAKVCGVILACCLALGNVDLLLAIKKNIGKILVIAVGGYMLSSVIIQMLYEKFDKFRKEPVVLDSDVKEIKWGKCVLVMLLCWIPYWIAYYPAVLTPDSISQIRQVLNLDPLVNHHPILHTMTIKVLYDFITAMGVEDINQVISLISLIQMIFVASVFSAIICFLFSQRGSKTISYVFLFFYALIPFNAYYSITLWKDITHAVVTSLLLLALIKYCNDEIKNKPIALALLALLGTAFCLYRSNGYYAYILWLLPLTWISFKIKKQSLILVALGTIIVSSLIKGPLYNSFDIKNASYFEGLSIPEQQIAYVIKNKRELNDEQKYYLGKVIDLERVPSLYHPQISDNIKGNCHDEEFAKANKLEYLKLWAELGVKYPKDYVIAWINQTRGYWYPNIGYWVYGKGVHPNTVGIYNEPNVVRKVIDKISLERLYGPATLYNVGIYTWILLVMFIYALSRRMWKVVLCYSLLLGILVSLLLGTPVFAEFRYYYSIIANLPFIIMLPFLGKRTSVEKVVGGGSVVQAGTQ